MYCQRKVIFHLLTFLAIFFSQYSQAELSSFTAHYTIKSLGITQANASNILRIDKTHYRFESHIKPVGWIGMLNNANRYEYSEGLITHNTITPEKYSYQHTQRSKSNRHVEVIFDKLQLKIINFHKHINNKWKMPLVEKVQDRLSSQLSLILALQQSGNKIASTKNNGNKAQEFIFSIADGGRLKQYSFTIIAEEKLQTPLGLLNTIKLEHHRSHQDGLMIIWCAEEFGYLPVQIIQQQAGLPDYISTINAYIKE